MIRPKKSTNTKTSQDAINDLTSFGPM
uniref:Uncharacterized protein n=1 Tax=Arundo donax TaxID=35708 RepID=A0A0A9BFW3_ARUDO